MLLLFFTGKRVKNSYLLRIFYIQFCLMYDEASKSDTESIQSYSPSSSVTMRSVPIYRSCSQYDLDSVERKRHYRTSLHSRAVINKIVLDIRKSLYLTNKIFKSSKEQNHTDEIPKQVCFAYLFLFYFFKFRYKFISIYP